MKIYIQVILLLEIYLHSNDFGGKITKELGSFLTRLWPFSLFPCIGNLKKKFLFCKALQIQQISNVSRVSDRKRNLKLPNSHKFISKAVTILSRSL